VSEAVEEPWSSRRGSLVVHSRHPWTFCTGTLFIGHHEWTITVYESDKFSLNLSLNNDTKIIPS